MAESRTAEDVAKDPRPLGYFAARPKIAAHRTVALLCLTASCRIVVFMGTLAVPLNACPACHSGGVIAPDAMQKDTP